jgi:hypothetical protein
MDVQTALGRVSRSALYDPRLAPGNGDRVTIASTPAGAVEVPAPSGDRREDPQNSIQGVAEAIAIVNRDHRGQMRTIGERSFAEAAAPSLGQLPRLAHGERVRRTLEEGFDLLLQRVPLRRARSFRRSMVF